MPTLTGRPLLAAATSAVALLLAACGSGGGTAAPASSGPAAGAGGPSVSAEPATFPVRVTAANGPVAIPAEPRRLVSLSPTATEMLFAVGAGPQVAAVDDQSTYPASAPRTTLSGFKPNVEAVAKYDPDLVVLSDDTGGLVAALGTLKIPVLLEPAAKTMRDSYRQIEQLGAATGHVADSARVVATMQQDIAEVVRTAPKRTGVTVYHELDQTGYSVTSRTFIGSVYRDLGVRSIADSAPASAGDYPKLSPEFVVDADPDLIVLADTKCCGQNARTVAARPGWSAITAVRSGSVVPLDDDIASRWGPRVVQLYQRIGTALAALPAWASAGTS